MAQKQNIKFLWNKRKSNNIHKERIIFMIRKKYFFINSNVFLCCFNLKRTDGTITQNLKTLINHGRTSAWEYKLKTVVCLLSQNQKATFSGNINKLLLEVIRSLKKITVKYIYFLLSHSRSFKCWCQILKTMFY